MSAVQGFISNNIKKIAVIAVLAVGTMVPLTLTQSASADVKRECRYGSCTETYWRIAGKEKLANNVGGWRYCTGWAKSKTATTVQCSIERTSSKTVTTSVGGTATVKFATLSASVGYDVQRSVSATGSQTARAPKNTTGQIQWAAVYGNRYKVKQEVYKICVVGGETNCFNVNKSSNHYKVAYAYTAKFVGTKFKTVVNR